MGVGRSVGLAGSLVTALVGFGTLTVVQGNALTGLLGLIPGAVTGVTAVATAFGTARRGEPLVTPLTDPRSAAGERLVPAAGRHEA